MKHFPLGPVQPGAHSGLLRATFGLVLGLVVIGVSAVPFQAQSVAAGADEATLSLTLPTTIEGCAEAQIAVRVNNVTDLYGSDIKLKFASDVLEVVDFDPALDGIQVENGGFLQPGYVVRNVADNAVGTIQYALTQVNPTAPASGSGVLFVIHLRARSAQSATQIAFISAELSDRNGRMIPATAAGAAIATVAPQKPQLSITWLNASTATLSWTAASGVADYHLYREIAPYFTPVDPAYRAMTGRSYDDTGSLGDPTDNFYYVVKSACADGFKSTMSNRVGEFDFALVPGN